MKAIILLLFNLSLIFIAVGYVNQLQKTPPPQIEYRYIPRTFEQEQENPVKVSQLFNNMFEEPNVFVAGFKLDNGKNKDINKYYIST